MLLYHKLKTGIKLHPQPGSVIMTVLMNAMKYRKSVCKACTSCSRSSRCPTLKQNMFSKSSKTFQNIKDILIKSGNLI